MNYQLCTTSTVPRSTASSASKATPDTADTAGCSLSSRPGKLRSPARWTARPPVPKLRRKRLTTMTLWLAKEDPQTWPG